MMVNTRILQQEFDYFTPKSAQEAISLLSKYGSEAKIIAGGTDLIAQMKLEKISPVYLINILHVPELNHIEEGNDLRIGAAAKLRDVREFCSNNKIYIALFEAVSVLGKVQVWNMGTIGNLVAGFFNEGCIYRITTENTFCLVCPHRHSSRCA